MLEIGDYYENDRGVWTLTGFNYMIIQEKWQVLYVFSNGDGVTVTKLKWQDPIPRLIREKREKKIDDILNENN